MTESKFPKYLKILTEGRTRKSKPGTKPGTKMDLPPVEEEAELEPCCNGRVHIAYRGVSDDRLYMSHNRAFTELKYFRPTGLRVFCADCRRRMA